MLIKRKKHHVPELNTTATADISFMLLTFFLVTTSMDVDRGLVRQLPPIDNTQQDDRPTEVARENTLDFHIDDHSQVTLNGNPVDFSKLRRYMAEFIYTRRKQHVIYVNANPQASYDAYFRLENEIVGAYNDVRNRTAHKQFGRKYDELSTKQKQAVLKECPQHISETYNTTTNDDNITQ